MTIRMQASMIAASPIPIEDGDYVLVQSKSRAENNDIVAAGIIGHDERATIKRLKCDNGDIWLVPESRDRGHSEINLEKELGKQDGKLNIIEVMEAVFKKKS